MKLTLEEMRLIDQLRELNPSQKFPTKEAATTGQRWADHVTRTVGSWRFLIIQSILLGIWILLNITAYIKHWDPYPFILLNLMLSFQAAYTAPILLMSQNREAEDDRSKLEYYYQVNLKSELEIELLHQKIDVLHQMLNSEFNSK